MPILLCYLWTRAKGFIKTADSVNPLFPLPRTPPPITSEWCSSPGLELKAKGSKWSSKKSASGRIFLKSYCHYFLNIYASISIYFRCGGSVQLDRDTNSFEFSSPNYPQVPPAHAECIWVVMAPQGKRIQLDFTDNFRIRRSGGWDVLLNAVISSSLLSFYFCIAIFPLKDAETKVWNYETAGRLTRIWLTHFAGVFHRARDQPGTFCTSGTIPTQILLTSGSKLVWKSVSWEWSKVLRDMGKIYI